MIEMKGICKTYRVRRREAGLGNAVRSLFSQDCTDIPALREMTFSIPDGQIVGYIGPNGAGKSTTIKILSGILRPDSGACTVDGLTPWTASLPGRTGSATWPGWGWSSASAASCGGMCR